MKKKFLYFLTHPLTLTIISGFLIILFLPPLFKKYISATYYHFTIPSTTTYAWFDLDQDGASEEMNFFNTPVQPTIIVRKDKRMIAQWIFQGEFADLEFFYPADYDRNGIHELYVITCSNDSLYINGIEPFDTTGGQFLKKFLDTYIPSRIGKDCDVDFLKATDLNEDGFLEIVFSISTGWSAYPRKIYALDIHRDTLRQTPNSCATMSRPIAYDINQDGFDEYIPESFAFKNCPEDKPYNDHHAWLMVFDRNLEYLFPPIEMGPYMTFVKVRPIKAEDRIYIIVLRMHVGSRHVKNKLMLYSIHGDLLKEKEILSPDYIDDARLFNRNATDMDHVYIQTSGGMIQKIDVELNIKDVVTLTGIYGADHVRFDVDRDGVDEFIFYSSDQSDLCIVRNDFTHPVWISTPSSGPGYSFYFSVIQSVGEKPKLYYQNGEQCYVFNYFRNPLYYWRYLIYCGIFIGLYGLFYLIHRIQEKRANKRRETEKKITELQLKTIKGQTDPHFTLNLLNSLGALFDSRDKEKAGYIFGRYSKLLRNAILGSEHIDSTLATEIEQVENFLELEKFRYDSRFDYRITIDERVDLQIPVPRMLVHTFAENAVKHGIRHMDSGGLLTIVIQQDGNNYLIHVQDNGPGIKKKTIQADAADGTQRGLKIIDEILKLYLELQKVNISYRMDNLQGQDGIITGTSVMITVPLKKKK